MTGTDIPSFLGSTQMLIQFKRSLIAKHAFRYTNTRWETLKAYSLASSATEDLSNPFGFNGQLGEVLYLL